MIVDEYNLPAANINRVTKAALPAGTKVTKEARTGIARAATIFVM